MPPLPPTTQALMLVCVAMYCAGFLFPFLKPLLSLWPVDSGYFMPWQLVSYAFLHGDFTHLFFNMLALWMFGSELERLWGTKRYLQFLLASALAAAAVHLGWMALIGGRAPMVGASGATFGLLMAYGMLFPNRTLMLLIPPMPVKAKTMVIIFGGIELLFGLFTHGGIAHFAHLGGMLGAYLMIRFWRGKPPFGRRRS